MRRINNGELLPFSNRGVWNLFAEGCRKKMFVAGGIKKHDGGIVFVSLSHWGF
ncbi:MAG: hypothetical protein HY064_02225 [Bacteroidetes bacterium]|nr:hypothetical protein [Bacteroidota bacterium]